MSWRNPWADMERWRRRATMTAFALAAASLLCTPRTVGLAWLLPSPTAMSVSVAAWFAMFGFLFAALVLYSTRPKP